MKPKFSTLLKHARHLAGITQSQLALNLDVHTTYISKLETGTYIPAPSLAAAIAKALNTSPIPFIESVALADGLTIEDIFGMDATKVSKWEYAWVKRIRELSPENIELLNNYIDLLENQRKK